MLRYVAELTSGRLLLMSTRHFLIRTEAGSGVRLLGLLSSVLRSSPVVVVGIVVCAVHMGSAELSILCVRDTVSVGREISCLTGVAAAWSIIFPDSESVRGGRRVAVVRRWFRFQKASWNCRVHHL